MNRVESTGRNLQETRMEDLTEDVLLCIMSKLDLRDVVNFSAVCKQWSDLPYRLSSIQIDGVCTKNKDSFFRGVTLFLGLYVRFQSSTALPVSLSNFDIFVCFPRRNYTYIDLWILWSIVNGVRSLTVRPTCPLHYRTYSHDDKYIFPWKELQDSPVALKSLALQACIFRCTLTSKWISLRVLQLYHTNLTDYDMDKIWFCFPNLRNLVLFACNVPAKLTVRSGCLTSLKVWFCHGLNAIILVDAKSITDFNYRGNHIDLGLVCSPKLTKLMLGFFDGEGGVCSFQNLHGDAVKFVSTYRESERSPSHSPLHGRASAFSHLTELKFDRHPTCSIRRRTVMDILKACPLLSRLLMVPPCTTDEGENDIESDCIQYRHKCLKFIKIMGFCGSMANLEMTKFIIQIAEELCHLVIDSTVEEKDFKYVKHCADWHGEQEPKAVKEMLLGLLKNVQLTFTFSEGVAQVVVVNKYQQLFGLQTNFSSFEDVLCMV